MDLDASNRKKEILIYCGITMILPMQEIARIIEKEQDCVIKITKGGSGNLLSGIKANQMGDLYLPGSDSYMETAITDGLVVETVLVGYNQAALIVPKGNPKKITPDPANLANEQYAAVIANPKSGSIGRQTKKILEKRGVGFQGRSSWITSLTVLLNGSNNRQPTNGRAWP